MSKAEKEIKPQQSLKTLYKTMQDLNGNDKLFGDTGGSPQIFLKHPF